MLLLRNHQHDVAGLEAGLRHARLAPQHDALAVARAGLKRHLERLALRHEARAAAAVAAVACVQWWGVGGGCGGGGGGW
jgi:hypothetical protein